MLSLTYEYKAKPTPEQVQIDLLLNKPVSSKLAPVETPLPERLYCRWAH